MEEEKMNRAKNRLKLATAVIASLFAGAVLVPASAPASGESAQMNFTMTPRSGAFYKEAYRPANWNTKVTISTLDPEILPMKRADLSLPPRGQMTFNPKASMPVCPDSQVGPPPTNVSVPASEIVRRCGKSIIGNGTATFVLARNNLNPAARLDGYILVLNGGRVSGEPRIKVYAYSYDTGVGVYTEARLTTGGKLVFQIPQLTADSSVTELDLRIPSTNRQFQLPAQGTTITLPAGRDKSYVRARCPGGRWAFSGVFDLGTRDSSGNPTGPTSTVAASGVKSCVGLSGAPRITAVRAWGPRKFPRRGSRVYRVRVRNGGTAKALGTRIRVSGRWVQPRTQFVGRIPAGQARTYRVRVRLIPRQAKRGRRTAIRFRASAAGAGGRTNIFQVRVR
jgi:hypothetical protein